jgi:hypothetical protein
MANGKTVAGVSVSMELELAQFKTSCREAEAVTKQMTAQMREEMQQSRESVRLLSEELGLGIPRGLQGIISKLPGLSTAMTAAFDAVVVFALAKTIYEVGEKIVEFVHKTEEAAKKNAAAWEESHGKLEKELDTLTLTGAKLDETYDKMAKKPSNALALALDDARVTADTLADSLKSDLGLMDKLFADTSVSKWQILLGQYGEGGNTDDTHTMLEGYRTRMNNAERSAREAVRGATTPEGAQSAQSVGQAEVDGIVKEALDAIAKRSALINGNVSYLGNPTPYANVYGNQDKNNAMLAGGKDIFENSGDIFNQQIANSGKVIRNQKMGDSNTANAEALKGMEESFRKQKAYWGMSVEDEIKYWSDRLSAFAKGSDQYKAVQDKLYADYEARSKQFEDIRKSVKLPGNIPDDISGSINMEPHEGGDKIAAELAKGYEAYAKFGAELDAVKLKASQATGAMNPHQAAIAAAAASTRAYVAELKPLNEQLDKLKKELPSDENTAKQMDVGNQISQVTYRYHIQQVTDGAEEFKTSFTGQMDETFNSIINRAEDWGAQFKSTVEGALGDVNNAIVHVLTTRPQAGDHPFQEAGKAIFTGVARSGLQDAEGSLMKGLGLGKLGTEANPMWVKMAGAAVSSLFHSGGSVPQVPMSMFNAMMPKAASSVGGFITPALTALSMMAGGGVLSPGDFYMTGEQGPELMQVGSTSKINNARDTSAIMAGSGGGDTHIHLGGIDARGATDPAAVYQAAQRAIYAAAPHLLAGVHTAQKDDARRRPSR